MIIGVTGKYCAGKSLVSRFLQGYGFTEIDADKVGHDVLQAEKERVTGLFGGHVLDRHGMVDRKKLGRIVFKDKKRRKQLEALLHPLMREKIASIVAKPGQKFIINAALLFRMKLHLLCNFVVFVSAPFRQRFKRARERDHLRIIDVLQRFFAQGEISSKLNAGGVDIYYVSNKGSIGELKTRLKGILWEKKIEEV
jgi:dephospho-CoA kinase